MIEYKEPMVIMTITEYNQLKENQYDDSKFIKIEDEIKIQEALLNATEYFLRGWRQDLYHEKQPNFNYALEKYSIEKSYNGLYKFKQKNEQDKMAS